MCIPLTANQVRRLRPFIERARMAKALGRPGMLVAQVQWSDEGRYWMSPAFFNNELAQAVQARVHAALAEGATG